MEKSGVKNEKNSTEILYKVSLLSLFILPFVGMLIEYQQVVQLYSDLWIQPEVSSTLNPLTSNSMLINTNTSMLNIVQDSQLFNNTVNSKINQNLENPNWQKTIDEHTVTTFVFSVMPYLLLQAIMGTLLNKIMFECIQVNSALYTSLIGLAKSTLTSILGLFTFGGIVLTCQFMIGLGLNIMGSCVFVYAKFLN